ncbi:hypothetical protein WJX84_009063 [Apatococcus fuscideae]|uniref:Uncharacterized protein n=1 Tax=Apatococcus fuscideae TaxID=2026836 RepID=A0AAW1TI23_9CHLO
MQRSFLGEGLDLEAVQHTRKYYADPDSQPVPRPYKKFCDPKLYALDVRLLAFLVAEEFAMAESAVHATEQIFKHVPAGAYKPARAPAHDSLHDKERRAIEPIASAIKRPILQVEQIVLANSGTLLLCFRDQSPNLHNLRAALRHQFPGAPTKQSSICHVTLGRILSQKQIASETRATLAASCQEWSNKLQGKRFSPAHVWHILEETFTKCDGPRQNFPFASSSA